LAAGAEPLRPRRWIDEVTAADVPERSLQLPARLAASTVRPAGCLKHCADQMEFERARDLLRRERVRIEQALARVSVPGREELAGQDEMADAASQLYEEEFDEGQADDLGAELAAVERAEARLLDGSYGRSIESGEEIPDERLEAVPTAERTAEEQARFERG
jgi:RNA polymerase-binding transcription factor